VIFGPLFDDEISFPTSTVVSRLETLKIHRYDHSDLASLDEFSNFIKVVKRRMVLAIVSTDGKCL
jgi:hypothetical protein